MLNRFKNILSKICMYKKVNDSERGERGKDSIVWGSVIPG